VKALAEIDDASLSARATLPYKTELLFQRFRTNWLSRKKIREPTHADESLAGAEWMKICRKHLYPKDVKSLSEGLKTHPYFSSLLGLVRQSHLTVDFNFDNYLEQALHATRLDTGKDRGFEVVVNPWPQTKRKDSVIFHPHGMVPSDTLMEAPVDRFVFSEAGYARQYVGAGSGDTSFLLAHLAKHTCLVLGCGLEDVLRSVLIQGAHLNPGNYHYYVQYLGKDAASHSAQERQAIADTNFRVYNLITLFLTDVEIRALLKLINAEEMEFFEFQSLAAQVGQETHYKFYMTGPLGVGKSTAAGNFRNLAVLDEWLEPRPAILGEPWQTLTRTQQLKADDWIANQFKAKNENLRKQENGEEAIAFVDRPPLDPLVFTKPRDRRKKAKSLLDKICPGSTTGPRVYLAAPLFSDAEKAFNEQVVLRLERRGFDVYLPQRDGGLIVDLVSRGVEPRAAAQSIFQRDIEALIECDICLIVLDGRAVDEGAAFELGVAYSARKLCVGLQTDPRRLLITGNNPMLEGALSCVFESVEQAADHLSAESPAGVGGQELDE
jgi:nucleoside 2-deoxyribosyltransferase